MTDLFFIGQPVPLRFLLTDEDDVPADPTSWSLVVRKPDGADLDITADVTHPETGDLRADYYPQVPGRFVATLTAYGTVAAAIEDTFDVTPPAAAAITLTMVRSYLGDAVASQWDDTELARTLGAEQTAQARVCRIDPYSLDLAEALHRRIARNLAMRKLPLGIAVSEIEATRVGGKDPEVRRLEGPHRKATIG